MLKKLFEVRKKVEPFQVREDHFANTSESEINKTQTPVVWAKQTDYLILGKVRQIPSFNSIKKNTSTIKIYGDGDD